MNKRIYAQLDQNGILPDLTGTAVVLATEIGGDTVEILEQDKQFASFALVSIM